MNTIINSGYFKAISILNSLYIQNMNINWFILEYNNHDFDINFCFEDLEFIFEEYNYFNKI